MSVTGIQSETQFMSIAKNPQGKLVFCDFYADWCGPCKNIAPFIHDKARKEPNIIFIQVNVDNQDSISNYYKIKGLPTFIMLKNGKEIARGSGASTSLVEDLIKKAKMSSYAY